MSNYEFEINQFGALKDFYRFCALRKRENRISIFVQEKTEKERIERFLFKKKPLFL